MNIETPISPVTKDDLKNAKYWIKHFGGGIKKFAEDIDRPYISVRMVLDGRRTNSYIIMEAVKKAIEIGGPISARFQALKGIPKY